MGGGQNRRWKRASPTTYRWYLDNVAATREFDRSASTAYAGADAEVSDKVALITGVTGQDGALLARLLLDKGYVVHGIKRRSSSFNTGRVDDIYVDPHESETRFFLHYGDLTDATNLDPPLAGTRPHEIYNLAAQSHVQVSFETPEYTANADALGYASAARGDAHLAAARTPSSIKPRPRSCTARSLETPQRETTPFYPRSPYGVAKLYAYWITVNYREAYGMHASNGILFNHESPLRGETFVTRKITRAVAAIELGLQEHPLYRQPRCQARLGSRQRFRQRHVADAAAAEARRLCACHRREPQRARIHRARFRASGSQHRLEGQRRSEEGFDAATGRVIVKVDRRYFRPTEVDDLLGDASKARRELGWQPETSFADLVAEMVKSDLEAVGAETGRKQRSAY